ncbi:MAG TPA: hypothetical protein VFF04_01165 [Candidatus Babeliales bacterium]|nr:hypothetical protein [Candidatus Babeliales bacterium]
MTAKNMKLGVVMASLLVMGSAVAADGKENKNPAPTPKAPVVTSSEVNALAKRGKLEQAKAKADKAKAEADAATKAQIKEGAAGLRADLAKRKEEHNKAHGAKVKEAQAKVEAAKTEAEKKSAQEAVEKLAKAGQEQEKAFEAEAAKIATTEQAALEGKFADDSILNSLKPSNLYNSWKNASWTTVAKYTAVAAVATGVVYYVYSNYYAVDSEDESAD